VTTGSCQRGRENVKLSNLHPSRWTGNVIISIVVGVLGTIVQLNNDLFPEGTRLPLSIVFGIGVAWLSYKINSAYRR
jgi:hypothetical protein